MRMRWRQALRQGLCVCAGRRLGEVHELWSPVQWQRWQQRLTDDGGWVGERQVQWSVQPGPAVAQVSCGFGHTLLLDRQGGVWACGYAGGGARAIDR